MHTLTEKLQNEMTDFIAQRDALWLLVTSAVEDAPIVFKLLLECERNSRSEVFLLFGTAFVNAEQYAEAVVRQFVAEYRALDAARVARQHAPLVSLPDSLLAAPGKGMPLTPPQRIAAVIDAARRLLPSDGIYRLVSAFWPMEVADPGAYGKLLKSLLALRGDEISGAPWQHSVRLIAREIKGHGPLQGGTHVLRTESDFSAAALMRSLQQTIDDPHKPESVRVHALFTQATLDQASNRAAAAIAKYAQVLAYYQRRPNPNMQAVTLLQLGEAYQQQQRLPEARACYEQAVDLAVPVPVSVAMLAKNLGELAFRQQRYGDAAVGYKTWYRIASRLGDPEGMATALAKLTAAQECSGKAAAQSPSGRPLEAVR